MSINEVPGRRYQRIVWTTRAVCLILAAALAFIFFGPLSFDARFALMGVYVAGCWAGLGYLLLALRGLRRAAGGSASLWVPEELRLVQQDVLLRWRRPG